MINCTYSFAGQENLSFVELLDSIDAEFDKVADIKNAIMSTNDLVYSKMTRQEAIYNQIESIKKEYILNNSKVNSNFEDEPGGEGGKLTAQEFLDDPRCMIDGKSLIRPLNIEDYRRKEILRLEEQGIKDAEAKVDAYIANMQTIRTDAVAMHRIIGAKGASTRDTTDATFIRNLDFLEGTSFQGRDSLLKSIKHQMESFVHKNIDLPFADRKLLKNVGIESIIEELGQTITGHIDYLAIDKNGNLHLYVFKASTQPKYQWSKEKREKYSYYMAFLKQMLANNGVPVNNIELNIVPVEMQYDDNYTNLTGIVIGDPDNIVVSETGNYLFKQYNQHARYFVPSKVEIAEASNNDFEITDQFFDAMIPVLNLRNEGIYTSAIDLIKNAPNAGDSEPLIIREVNDEQGRWEVIIEGKSYRPKSARNKNLNPDIRDIVIKHIKDIQDERLTTVVALKQAIQNMADAASKGISLHSEKFISQHKGLSSNAHFIKSMLDFYFTESKSEIIGKDKKMYRYDWEILTDLLDYNIILMHNKNTGQLDVITLTSFNPDTAINFKNGQTNILGAYKKDVEVDTLRADYGNAEIIRAMVLLNQIIPKLNMEDMKLGKIHILSYHGKARSHSISDINKYYFRNIFDIVTKANKDIEIVNNFRTLKSTNFVDPFQALIQEYERITLDKSEADIQSFSKGKFEAVYEAQQKDEKYMKIKALRSLQAEFLQRVSKLSPETVWNNAKKDKSYVGDNCRMFLLVNSALNYLTGEHLHYEPELGDLNAFMSTVTHVDNRNIRIVSDNLATTFNSIHSEVESYHAENIRGFVMDFFKACGYDLTKNAVIGNEVRLYDDLFERDENNKRTMTFKNPWTDTSLKEHQKVFLKKALFQFYIIRNNNQNPLGFKDYDDPEIPNFIAKREGGYKYLWCPLMRASDATKALQNLNKDTWVGRAKRLWKTITNPEQWYDENIEKLTEIERKYLRSGEEESFQSLRNPFDVGDGKMDPSSRQRFLEEEGIEFFETNVHNLLVDYLSQHVETEKLNMFLVGTKSLLFQLQIMGEASGRSKIMEDEIKYIENLLKINVFNESIKTKTGKLITGLLAPVRTGVTLLNIGGNLISFFRDVFQGFQENYMRTVTKLNTDLSASNISAAYTYVISHGMTNTMTIDLLSKLQAHFKISNIDLASMESLKTARGGIANWRNLAFQTLRRPDFLNRMTLFVARCMQDGCWEAWSVKNDQLVYDWKKDKRFKALVDGSSKDSIEYKTAKALYMSKVKEYNEENPEHPVSLDHNDENCLPTPYSNKEILSIKEVADNIYGTYDKPLKAMGEHTTIMWFFGMYTTWMNGIYNNYFMKPGKYSTNMTKREQMVDDAGNPLFMDEFGNVVTDDTGLPLTKQVPILCQGIVWTIRSLYETFNEGGWQKVKEYLVANPQEQANMKKFFTDQFYTLLMFLLFTFALDPLYKDYKKEMPDEPILANLTAEIMYKSSKRSYDTFANLWNFKDWLGDNTASPIYETNLKVGREALKVLAGKQNLSDAFVNNIALARSGKDTYNAWKKAQE